MNNFGEISLVANNYRGYREFCSKFARTYRKIRSRDPLASEYTKQLQILENAVSTTLSQYLQTGEDRILRYLHQTDKWGQRVEYREIDCVVNGRDGEPEMLIELKFREKYREMTNTAQLRKSLVIAQERWKLLKGGWINVHMAELFGLDRDIDCSYLELADLNEFFQNENLGSDINLVWLSGVSLVEEAIERGLIEDDFISNLNRCRKAANDPCSLINKKEMYKKPCFGDLFAALA